jgi:hypothetical protein
MRSPSINFYMTDSDEREFVDYLFSTYDVAILDPARHETTGPNIISDTESFVKRLSDHTKNKNDNANWVIWFKEIGDYKPQSVTHKTSDYLGINLYWQPTVLFTRSRFVKGKLKEGYVSYVRRTDEYPPARHNEVELATDQRKQLIRIFEKLRRWFKKHGERATWDGVVTISSYIMPDAQALYHSGVQFDIKIQPEGYIAPNIKIPDRDLIDNEKPLLKQIGDYVNMLEIKCWKFHIRIIASRARTYENLARNFYTSKIWVEIMKILPFKEVFKPIETNIIEGHKVTAYKYIGDEPETRFYVYLHKDGKLQTFEYSKQIIHSELEKFRMQHELPPIKL